MASAQAASVNKSWGSTLVLDPGGHESGAQNELALRGIHTLPRFIVLGVAAVNTRVT